MENSTTLNGSEINEQIVQLREWLEKKPYVPDNIEDRLYLRFLHSCYYDLEKAKVAMDLFFSMRQTSPELFTNRDPLSAPMQKALKIHKFALSKSGNRNVWLCQLDDPGLRNYDHLHEAKAMTVSVDSWLLDSDDLEEEDIVIYDFKDVSIKMLTKFSINIARKVFKFQQEAVPTRLKQVHFINTPYGVNTLFQFVKTFLNKEMIDMIRMHQTNSTTLFDYVSRDDLPDEFGGTKGKFADEAASTVARFEKNRKYFIDENFWKCDKNAKQKKEDNSKSTSE